MIQLKLGLALASRFGVRWTMRRLVVALTCFGLCAAAPARAQAQDAAPALTDAPPAAAEGSEPPPVVAVAPVAPAPTAPAPTAPAPTAMAPQPLQPAPEAATKIRWYGWQTLACDGAAMALLIGGGVANSPIAYVSVPTYVLGGPIVHAAHGNIGRAFGSLGLRVGAPILGAVIGEELGPQGDFIDTGALAGFALGLLAAQALDAALLAYDEVPIERSARPTVRLAVAAGPGSIAVAGAF